MTWERLTRRLELPSWLKRGLSVVLRLFAVVLGLVAVVLGLFAAWASVEWFLEARRGAFAPWRAVSSLVLALGALAYGSRRLWPAKTGPRVNRMRVAKFAALGGFAGVVVTSCPSRPDLPSLGTFSTAEHPALGCWELRPSGLGGRYFTGPTRVKLDSIATGRTHRLVVDSSAVRSRRPIRGGWWPLDDSERVYLYWGDGYLGVGLTLVLRSDTLFGRTILTSDFGGPFTGGSAVGVRASCPYEGQP